MHDYIQYGPVMTAEPPIICAGADLYVYVVPAELGTLKHLCKRVFDVPSSGAVSCRPLAPLVVLIFGSIVKVSGSHGPAVHERNVLIHVPVEITTSSEMFGALFSPFVWVDNPNSVAGGRETFGYAKTMGAMHFTESADPLNFALDTFGGNLTDDYWGPQSNIIQIKRKALVPSPLLSILDLIAEAEEAAELLDKWTDTGVSEIFFKQFRSIDDHHPGQPARACLREIATAEYVIPPQADPQVVPLTHNYQIDLVKLDSHPFVAELGLPLHCTSPGFRVKTSFKVERGRVLWHG